VEIICLEDVNIAKIGIGKSEIVPGEELWLPEVEYVPSQSIPVCRYERSGKGNVCVSFSGKRES